MQRLEIKSTMTRVATVLLMLLTTATAWAQFSGGDGSENNPYEIASYDDLLTLRNNVNNGERYGNCYFRQTADIDWPDGITWDRGIGYSDAGSHYFRGRYDGNGNKIIGFRLATSEQNAGLFGYVLGDYRGTDATNNVIAEVKNVVLVDPVITAQATSGEQYVGTLVGYVSRCVKIDDNTVIGGSVTITGVSNNDNSTYAGGLVGYYYNGDWPSLKRNIVSGTTVSGAGVSGGLVGRLYFSYCVDQNFVDATVSSVQHTGDAGTFYRQGAVVGECYRISNNSNDFTWGYYHNTAGLTFFAKDANGNTKNDQLKTSRIYAVGIAPSDITVSGDGHHSFCDKHFCHGGASITLSGGTAPAGYLVSGYTSTDVTITNGVFTMPAKDITVSATFTPDPALIEQTATDEYTIHSAEGWGVFCDMLQDNANYNRFIGKTVKLDANITVTRMAGSDNHDICGTFDGCGHTITLDGNTKTNGCYALFRNAVGATIQNLHVDGTISTAGAYAAGLISGMWGMVKIKNCRVSVNILSSQSGECSHGGLVAKNNSGTLEITGCVFDGKLLTTNGSTRCGGFVGWNGGTLTISNSLYAPAELKNGETWVGNDYSSPFACNGATISNCYYTRDFNDGTHYTAQGKAPRTVEAGDYVTIEAVSPVGSPVEDGTYTVSGITAYAKGITRGDAFYYGNGDEVSLTLSHAEPPAGYTFIGYSASAGTLDGTTLTMPGDGDVTINANYEFIKFTQGALSYECTSGTEVKVTACNTSATSVTIPATVTDNNVTYTVTAIAADAFSGCTALTTVIMEPTTPPTLGNDAFANCNELANIYVPAGTSGAYKTAWADYASKIEDYGTCGTNVYWSYNSTSHKLTIFGTGAMADYSYSNRPWFSFRTDITTVDIRNGVTTIGEDAFDGCNALTNISIPTSVTSIGDYAFSNCYSLSSIELPTSLTSICKGTFNTCKSLTSITIPAGVTSIDDQAFEWCTALTSIDLPASVTSIGYFAFSLCTALSSIELPTSLTTICEKAFEACTSLTSITIPASVTRIDSYAFVKCSSLESISVAEGNTVYDSRNGCNAIIIKESNKLLLGCKNTVIPTGVTSIGKEAFYKCTGLTSITIPESVTSIGEEAFESCNSLTTVIMQPTTPPTLGNDVFENCDELANIYVPAGTTETYKTTGNWATYKDIIQTGGTCGTNVYWSYNSTSNTLTIFGTGDMTNDFEGNNWEKYLNDITTVNISNGVTSIGDYAFSFCTGLTSIEIPASVKTIGNYAFQGCWGLTSIEIPASVTTIGNAAFNTCIYLTSINIPANVTTIGNEAFGNCTGLTSITIPASVTSIGYWAFINCIGLESISVAAGNTIYDSRNGCNALIETASNTLIQGCKNTVIPNTVTSIGDYAFYGCEELKEITIPASVTSIGDYAFQECTSLTTVFMEPTTPPTLGNYVFNACDELDAIYVPAGTSGDYKAAWTDYAGKIEDYGSCGENVNWSYNTDSHKLTIFGTGAMADYSYSNRPWYNYLNDITTVDIRAGVTTIGNEAFYECTALTGIELPASVTSIGYQAFSRCYALSSIELPTSVTSIGDEAFYGCVELEVWLLRDEYPITQLGADVFDECDDLIIYVPTDKVTDYKAAWSDYADKIKGFGEMEVLGLNDHVDNSTYIALCNGVTLDVNLCGLPVYKDGDWNTLCLPFDLTIEGSCLDGDNVLAMTLDKETSGLSGTTLTLNFTKATTIPAGTPFIIKWDNMHVIYCISTIYGVTIDNTDGSVTSSDGYVTFKGTYDRLEWNTENNSILFLGANNTLYWPQPSNNQTPYLNAFRAYFQLNNGLTAAEVSAARMNFEDDATGISDALRLNDKGQMTNDNFYDLQGRKIEKPTKGLYIHNGKKVIIK